MTDHDTSEDDRLGLWVFVAIGVALVCSLVGVYYAPRHLPYRFSAWVSLVGVAWSGLLTIFLAYIYDSLKGLTSRQTAVTEEQASIAEDQVEIAENQSEIMADQESLMRLEHVPELKVASWSVEANRIELTLANLRPGPAASIGIGIDVRPQNIDYTEVDPKIVPLYQGDAPTRKNFLLGESTESFIGKAVATTCVGAVQQWEFTRIANHLCHEGETRIEFVIVIQYQDMFGVKKKVELTSMVTDIRENMTFQDAVETADATNTVALHTPPDNVLNQVTQLDQTGYFFDPRDN